MANTLPSGVHVGTQGCAEDLKVLDEMMKEAYPGMPLSYTILVLSSVPIRGDAKGLRIVPAIGRFLNL